MAFAAIFLTSRMSTYAVRVSSVFAGMNPPDTPLVTRTIVPVHALASATIPNTRQCTTITSKTHHYAKLSIQNRVSYTLNTTRSNRTHYYVNQATIRSTTKITNNYYVKCSTQDYHTRSNRIIPSPWGPWLSVQSQNAPNRKPFFVFDLFCGFMPNQRTNEWPTLNFSRRESLEKGDLV